MMMNTLSEKHCVPCEGGVPAMDDAAAKAALAKLARGWELAEAGKSLRREFKFVDFFRTMSFVNALAHVANVEDHHPDLEIGYDYCRVRYSTHAIGGLSENDFICAAKCDALFDL
jgi:4a-hydroxytetrahydrobiopterin dehydratase